MSDLFRLKVSRAVLVGGRCDDRDALLTLCVGLTLLAARNALVHRDLPGSLKRGRSVDMASIQDAARYALEAHPRIRDEELAAHLERQCCAECYDRVATSTTMIDDVLTGGNGLAEAVDDDEAVAALLHFIDQVATPLADDLRLDLAREDDLNRFTALVDAHTRFRP